MNKILKFKITNPEIINLQKKCNVIAILFCLLSFYITYYFFQLYNQYILIIGLNLFKTGLSIKVASIISGIFIQSEIEKNT